MSRFQKFFQTGNVSGKKILGSMHAELKAASTKDKFVLNDVARKLMGVKAGKDRVIFWDHVGQEGVTSQEDRFFIAKAGVDENGTLHGALVGKGGTFSFSGIWSAFHMNSIDVVEARADDMLMAGKVIKTDVKIDEKTGKEVGGAYIANQLVLGNLEIAKDVDEDGNTVELVDVEIEPGLVTTIYAVKNLRFVKHDPRVEEKDDDFHVGESIDANDETSEDAPARKSRK